ncbi:beta-propeller fold lactonase family protein [Isoptericola sp. b441]|uniref:Beta-propeller fold lactonase family protein n=1 Tax=Actinotalea lenta TaxID=3064654 RepID=A0ABT9DCG9_9CELL|nr:beta-propeller fold lactonase family protein [Isoptericola sp. b441]MDO8106617.1 beta-propeller fold lactonase family protein [Isoptericola sp. b441]
MPAATGPQPDDRPAPALRAWVGTYPAVGAGSAVDTGEGIWAVTEDSAGRFDARQVSRGPAPSFLALSPDGSTLLAVGETSPGMVVRYAVQPGGGLVERERVTSGGADPCHLLVHPSGRSVYVSQYGSGSLAVLPLEPDADEWRFAGGIGQVFEHSGRGPRERQAGPHVHSSVLLGDWLLALDLGTDELRRYRVAPDGALTVEGVAGRLPHGAGPRHAAVTSEGHLAVTAELDAHLYLLRWDAEAGVVEPLDRIALGEPGAALPAHVVAHGDRLVVGVRGPDEVVTVRAAGGRLAEVGRRVVATWPRHHALLGDRLLVAGERAHRVDVHLQGRDGTDSGEAVQALTIPSPACVLAV